MANVQGNGLLLADFRAPSDFSPALHTPLKSQLSGQLVQLLFPNLSPRSGNEPSWTEFPPLREGNSPFSKPSTSQLIRKQFPNALKFS